MKRTVAALIALAVSTLALAQNPDREIAALYRDASVTAIEAGNHARASELVDVGLEFAPAESDLLFLRAFLWSVDGAPSSNAILAAQTALEVATWDRFVPSAAAALLIAELERTGLEDTAAALFEETPARPGDPPWAVRALYWTTLRAQRAAGRWDAYNDLLERARDRFPDDARFLWLLIMDEAIPNREARQLLLAQLNAVDSRQVGGHDRGQSRGQAEHEASSDNPEFPLDQAYWVADTREALYQYARSTVPETERAWARERLVESGWDDPRLALLFLDSDVDRAIDIYAAAQGPADAGTTRTLLRDASATAGERLVGILQGYSGESFLDSNEDHVWDERYEVVAGELTRMIRDADQDGLTDIEFVIRDGSPATALFRDREPVQSVHYGQYPFVRSVELEVEGGIERFVLRPRSVRLESVTIAAGEPFSLASDPRLLDEIRTLETAELIASAIESSLVSEGVVVERRIYERGEVVRIMRDDNRDGSWDHLQLISAGLPSQGVRDIDSDGYFEVAEGYRGGRLVALAVDSDRNGLPEYFERRDEVPVREWDLNNDGTIDAREFDWWTAETIREFPDL